MDDDFFSIPCARKGDMKLLIQQLVLLLLNFFSLCTAILGTVKGKHVRERFTSKSKWSNKKVEGILPQIWCEKNADNRPMFSAIVGATEAGITRQEPAGNWSPGGEQLHRASLVCMFYYWNCYHYCFNFIFISVTKLLFSYPTSLLTVTPPIRSPIPRVEGRVSEQGHGVWLPAGFQSWERVSSLKKNYKQDLGNKLNGSGVWVTLSAFFPL